MSLDIKESFVSKLIQCVYVYYICVGYSTHCVA